MGRRQRHQKFHKYDNAGICFDASSITGLSNNDPISTFPELVNGWNATAAGAARPTFIANGINGRPVSRWSGAQVMGFGDRVFSAGVSAFAVLKLTTGDGVVLGNIPPTNANRNHQLFRKYTNKSLAYFDGAPANSTIHLSQNNVDWTVPTISFISYTQNSKKVQYYDYGVNMGESSFSAPDNILGLNVLGGHSTTVIPWNGDIAFAMVINSEMSGTPLQQRIEHALAYSYKIACS